MDPAGPMYQGYPIEASLNPTCASFVDVIHTNGQGGLVMNYGSMRALGDMDFYPNAADVQPGCATRIGGSFGLSCFYLVAVSIPALGQVESLYLPLAFASLLRAPCPFVALACVEPKDLLALCGGNNFLHHRVQCTRNI